MTINHAILHAFDFETSSNFESSSELDLSQRQTRSYVTRSVRKTLQSPESNHGTFARDSAFHEELARYAAGSLGFVELSRDVADFFYQELRQSEEKPACDLMVADVTDTQSAPAPADDEAIDAAFEGGNARHVLAILLLPRKQGFVHDVRDDEATVAVERTDSLLPTPAQKVDTYAVVDLDSWDIDFRDKPRTIAGQERLLVPEGLLQCSSEASTKEVVDTVTLIVEDVAEEYGLTPAVEVSRAKAYVSEHADETEAIEPQEVGRKVFRDQPEALRSYEQRVREAPTPLPEEVPVRPAVAHRLAKSHRIRTDTGIEITFPSEYSDNADFIEFTTLPDGHISITIKGVEKIENR